MESNKDIHGVLGDEQPRPLRDKLGVCQWFHYEAYRDVERAVQLLESLNVRHLRTGISWADFHRPGGQRWYDWQMKALADFDVLLSVWHTPPSIAEGGCCASPPRRLGDYADFVGQVIGEYGTHFSALELWNEPNNRYKWDFLRFDPKWEKFGAMLREAAVRAKKLGTQTVLGGMIPVDHNWLQLMERYGALEAIDVVAIHAFPGMWWADAPCWEQAHAWQGWEAKAAYIGQHLGGRALWVTETGLATWDLATEHRARHEEQVRCLEAAAQAPADRVYWYSLVDLHPAREAIEGFHVDENEYHMGLVTFEGQPKPSYERMRQLLQESV